MENYKCPYCGGILKVDGTKKSAQCPYCDSFVVLKKENEVVLKIKHDYSIELKNQTIRKQLISRGILKEIPKSYFLSDAYKFGIDYFLVLYDLESKKQYLKQEEQNEIDLYCEEARTYLFDCFNGKINSKTSAEALVDYYRIIKDIQLLDKEFDKDNILLEQLAEQKKTVASANAKETAKSISKKVIVIIIIAAIVVPLLVIVIGSVISNFY